ncbi:MAG: multiple sugar transport system substrate-binding protein [Clostridiales bacterium]|nr:multiple sugar transport system substrate-binding protein [Clostridiales bacterium]
MKKKIIWGLLLLGIAAIALSVWKGSQRERAQREEETSTDMGKKELVLWSYYETNAQKEGLDLLMNKFNRSQDAYHASWQYVPMTEFTKRLSIGIMEGNLPDLVIIDNPDMKTYAELGIFEDLTPYQDFWQEEDAYYAEVFKSVKWDGHYYGLPFTCNNVALIYNKEMLKQAKIEPPKTWEELRVAAKMLTKENCSGFLMSCVEGEQSAFQVLPWILSAGENKDSLGGEKTIEAFSFLENLCKDGSMDPNCVSWSQNDVARKFAAGETAMMENGPWVLPILKEASISYGIAPLPMKEKHVVISGGENIGVTKKKDVSGAISFLEYYKSGDVMQEICKTSSVLPPKKEEAKKVVQDNEDFRFFEEQMQSCQSRAEFKDWASVSEKLSDAVYGVVTGEMSAKDAAEHLK